MIRAAITFARTAVNVLKRAVAVLALPGFVLAVLSAQPVHAATEYELKAAFIYNVMRFVEWLPGAGKDEALSLCVLGRDPFGGTLDALGGRQVQGRALRVRRVATVDEGSACNALFVARSEEPRLAAVLNALSSKPVLTFSDIDKFADRGGAVGMLLVDDRLRFEVNMATARTNNLRISAQVLKLAQRVVDTKAAP